MIPQWFAVMTQAGQEAHAERHLRKRGFWVFYPHQRVKERRGRNKLLEIVDRPLFSRYVFVALRHPNETFEAVDTTYGVATVVRRSFSKEPLQIPTPVMDALIEIADAEGLVPSDKPPHWFKGREGDTVELVDEEPYFGLVARIASISELDAKGRIRVFLRMLGAEREVDVPLQAVATLRVR